MSMVQMLPKEYTGKLTYFELPGGHWTIGLPIGVNPSEVIPPCFISIGYTNVGVQYENGIVSLAPSEPLPIMDIVQFLSKVDIHQFSPVSSLSVAYTINNAVQFLCDLTRLPVPT